MFQSLLFLAENVVGALTIVSLSPELNPYVRPVQKRPRDELVRVIPRAGKHERKAVSDIEKRKMCV